MTITLTDATREHEAAAGRLQDLEHRAVKHPPESRPAPAEVAAARVEVEHSGLRVEHARKLDAAEREQARLAGLEKVGADVGSYSQTDPDTRLRAALDAAHQAVQVYRAMLRAHDQAVADLCKRAAGFADTTGLTSPVGRGRGGSAVSYQGTLVRHVGDAGRIALETALSGDLPKGRGILATVRQGADRAPHYFLDTLTGHVMACHGSPNRPPFSIMVADGRARKMTEEEISAYLKGNE